MNALACRARARIKSCRPGCAKRLALLHAVAPTAILNPTPQPLTPLPLSTLAQVQERHAPARVLGGRRGQARPRLDAHRTGGYLPREWRATAGQGACQEWRGRPEPQHAELGVDGRVPERHVLLCDVLPVLVHRPARVLGTFTGRPVEGAACAPPAPRLDNRRQRVRDVVGDGPCEPRGGGECEAGCRALGTRAPGRVERVVGDAGNNTHACISARLALFPSHTHHYDTSHISSHTHHHFQPSPSHSYRASSTSLPAALPRPTPSAATASSSSSPCSTLTE